MVFSVCFSTIEKSLPKLIKLREDMGGCENALKDLENHFLGRKSSVVVIDEANHGHMQA